VSRHPHMVIQPVHTDVYKEPRSAPEHSKMGHRQPALLESCL
jgi:hypothetical protein